MAISGVPRIELTVDSTTRYANYHAGSGGTRIVFRHSPVSGDIDLDGIGFASTQIDLNGGSIRDLAGNPAGTDFSSLVASLSGVNINAAAPQVTGLANDSTPKKSKTWNWGCNYPPCTFRYSVDQVSTTAPTGAYTSDTSTDQTSGDGTYYLHIQTRDQSGDTSNVQHFSAILDNTIPFLNSILPPGDAIYSEAQAVDFTFNFSESVNVVGYPRVTLTIGGGNSHAYYHSGTGSNTLIFRYLPLAGHTDSNGITLPGSHILLNGGSIKDTAGNDATTDFDGLVPPLFSVKIDAENPSITSMSVPTDATYDSSSNLDFKLTFNEDINVTGAPRLSLNVGGQTRYANYHATASNVLTFRYIPQVTDQDNDGISFQSSIVHLNAGTITDAAGNNADLNFPASVPDLSGVEIEVRTVKIDSATPPADGIYGTFQGLHFTLTFSDNVSVTGTPRLSLQVGSTTRYAEYVSTSMRNVLFRYVPQNSDFDDNGIAFSSPWIDLNGGTLNDAQGNPIGLDFSAVAPDLTGVTVDAVLPVVSGLSDDSVYKKSKTWNWGCSKANCNYRFVVDTNPSTVPTNAYSATDNTSRPNGDGTYYLHVQARDSVGNESVVGHFFALLDNTAPNFSGVVDVSDDGATISQTVAADWSATVSSDALSGVAKIEIAIGRDVTGDGVDAVDRNNVMDWREIPGALSLDPAQYQIRNGVDGFSLGLAEQVNYFTSLRLEDAAGNKSIELSSREWWIFNPRRVAGLELWLDGQDGGTLFQNSNCTDVADSTGDAVACWRDKSGNDRHALQTDTTKTPIYQIGGHVRFDNRYKVLNAGNILAGNYDELSVFIVFRQQGGTHGSYSLPVAFNLNAQTSSNSCGGPVSERRISSAMFNNHGSLYWEFGGCNFSNTRMAPNANSTVGDRHFYELGNSATDQALFVRKDGYDLQRRTVSLSISPSSSGEVLIGNGTGPSPNSAVNGQISEFFLYTSHIGTTDRERLEGYLACKWGLQADLTPDHPYLSTCP